MDILSSSLMLSVTAHRVQCSMSCAPVRPLELPVHAILELGGVTYAVPARRRSHKKAPDDASTPDFLALPAGGFSDLPNTRDEIVAASRALGWQSKLLFGRDATETAVKSLPLASFDIIHIATHGLPSAEFPDRAALVLAPDSMTGEDGLLQARETRKLPIRAELVVLSACDTGVGTLQGQEGIANLVRAFLFAGAEAVVASLWGASDIYATHLMTRFYGHLAEGDDKAVALQHAKLDSLQMFGSRAAPFYWAGFVIVGDAFKPIRLIQMASRRRPPPTVASDDGQFRRQKH